MSGHRFAALALAAAALSSLSSVACTAEVADEDLGQRREELSAPKKAFCTIPVDGRGSKQMETDYIPHVITCENGGASLEALKAQAIAARSVAYYSMLTKGSICDSQGCQVYGCGAAPSERAKRAAKETAGMYLSSGGTLTYAFYVAGDSGASAPGCKDFGGSTSHYVTYNWGKTGKHIDQTSLGYQGPPGFGQNRGCMSQWGARCLENQRDFNHLEILRFYYGQDITVSQASGPCVTDEKTLRAKLTKKWSSAKRERGKHADYIVCAGQPFAMTYSFKNTGSATWRDVLHRGKPMGSDVFLVTANGKSDALTGRKRFSLAKNANSEVRGDHKAKNCLTKDGCRKTRFIEGGMGAVAPKKPGVYSSRWRLRDYSKYWGKKSHGFGPKVELRVKVVACEQQKKECGCRAWCTNGKSHALAASIDTGSACQSIAQSFCGPGNYLDHSFTPCPSGSSEPGSSPGAGGASNPSEPGGGAPTTEPGAGGTPSGSESGAGGTPSGSESGAAPTEEPEDEELDNGVTPDEGEAGDEDDAPVEDDADFTDDGFDGDAEGGVIPLDETCAVSTAGAGARGSLGLLGLCLGLVAVLRRRGRKSQNEYTG
ncbi:MAG: hypothetical protein IPI67_11155 [Myxococcales bacterium]|nr:hypothetical protein [Myxococcales bacterium]